VGGSPEHEVVMGDLMVGSWSHTWVTVSPRVGMLGQRSQRIRNPHARDRVGDEWHCSAVRGRGGRVACVGSGRRGDHGRTMGWWARVDFS
jgi:hypothetical protein